MERKLENGTNRILIDQGNTQTKYCTVENDTINGPYPIDELKSHPITNKVSGIISSVGNIESATELRDNLKNISNEVLLLNHATPLPISISYGSPKTLGSDRIALAVGGSNRFSEQNVLIIDSGTCITFDLVTDQGDYLGGSIQPGIDMRFHSLHHFTARLPLVETDYSPPKLWGNDTRESIYSGVMKGALAEVQGLIEDYSQQFNDLQVVITGGNASFFEKHINYPIFADALLLFKGLNAILEHNKL